VSAAARRSPAARIASCAGGRAAVAVLSEDDAAQA